MARLSDTKEDFRQRVIIYGPPKSGKTELASKLALKYNILWFDLEKGYAPLFKLPAEAQERVRIISIPDTKDNPVAVKTMLKVVTGEAGFICEKHGEWKCGICGKNPEAAKEDVHLRGLDSSWVLVMDSLTQLVDSALNLVRGNMPDTAKSEWDHWAAQGALISKILGAFQQLGVNVCVISHDLEVEQEDKTIKLVPVSGTRNASRNTGRFFDHVLYMRVTNMKHSVGSATTYLNKVLTGSRLDIEIEKMEFPSLAPFFDPDDPVNIAAKAKREEDKLKAANSLSKAGNAVKKLTVPLIKK